MISTPQVAARIRAARAYANKKQPELATHLGYSTRTWVRIERGDKPLNDMAELERVADFCHVPLTFLQAGFIDTSNELTERLERVEDLIVKHMAFTRDRAQAIADDRQTTLREITQIVINNHHDITAIAEELRELRKELLERELEERAARLSTHAGSTATGTGSPDG